ncbi:MAG: hypothetical protein ACTH4U_08740 [Pseudoalteromonas prydzensis]|uniref:hypothetical protein n=1 Tax=Pseudoalteromonas prydzensis TaxID=182141 RepID=UPI003F9B3067
MRKPDLMEAVAVVLCVCAGIILGQSFSFEVKLSDLIALTATLITFWFAYNGLRHNEKQYMNSVRPILYKYEEFDNDTFQYELSVQNLGTGAALNVDFIIDSNGSKRTIPEYINFISPNIEIIHTYISEPAGLSRDANCVILRLKVPNIIELEKLKRRIGIAKLILSFDDIQEQREIKSFHLGFSF